MGYHGILSYASCFTNKLAIYICIYYSYIDIVEYRIWKNTYSKYFFRKFSPSTWLRGPDLVADAVAQTSLFDQPAKIEKLETWKYEVEYHRTSILETL